MMNEVIYGFYGKAIKDGKLPSAVYTYHVTKRDYLPSILESGLIAKECKATLFGDYRRKAVYMFAYRVDAFDDQLRKALFGSESDLVVLKIRIPCSHYDRMQYDGIFNMSIECSDGSYPSAIQYIDNIPADWIKEII